jgi:hypothetical protein
MIELTKDYVHSRLGMAIVSAQRVEFVTKLMLEFLSDFDKSVFGITTKEFLEHSEKAKSIRNQTLGMAFKKLKLNPQLVPVIDIDKYLEMRNFLVHRFWIDYLEKKDSQRIKEGVDFCYEFGRLSMKVESYFRGFFYFLNLKLSTKLNKAIDSGSDYMKPDYLYFQNVLETGNL